MGPSAEEIKAERKQNKEWESIIAQQYHTTL